MQEGGLVRSQLEGLAVVELLAELEVVEAQAEVGPGVAAVHPGLGLDPLLPVPVAGHQQQL